LINLLYLLNKHHLILLLKKISSREKGSTTKFSLLHFGGRIKKRPIISTTYGKSQPKNRTEVSNVGCQNLT
jgi:hypothetical protein